MDLWLGTLRALLAPTRAIPMGIVVTLLLFEQGRWSRDPRALPVAAALCLSFVLLAPAAWRIVGRWEVGWPLRLSVYGTLGIACVSLIGGWLPRAIGVTSSFLTEGGSLSIATALFWVGGWGLGRDIDLELGLLDARRRAIELEREAERARLFALAQHLDPHFLFNTLNAIAEWCHEDSAVAEKAILQLSSMLRTLLGGVQRSSWPLRDELALVSSLVNLHATRDPDMLSLRLREEGDLDAVSVPPMLLLQVVENAIKHGPSRGHRGVIEIAVEVSRGRVSVEVSNPGAFAGERPGGQGLALLRRRLALAYTGATMTIAPRGERTAVSLLLPLKPQEHADLSR